MADTNTPSTSSNQNNTGSGITSQRIQNILNGVDSELKLITTDNILHEYDNYNYHIKFYMVDQDAAHKYTSSRRRLNNNEKDNRSAIVKDIIDKIHNNGSVIIAETGKTEDIVIESMTVETITCVPGRGISTTAEVTLKLKELGGCSLVNKITYASKCLGQDSYVGSLYFIDVWFSGYKNYEYHKKTIEEKIPFISDRIQDGGSPHIESDKDGEFLTYAMIISEVKTEKDGLNTNYTIKLVGTNFNLQVPTISTINMEKIKIEKGGTFSKTIDNFETKLNETLREMLIDSAKSIYKDDKIIKFIITDRSSGRTDDTTNTDSFDVSKETTTQIVAQSVNSSGNAITNPTATGVNPPAETSKSSESQGSSTSSSKDFNLDSSDNIFTAVTKIWNVFDPMSGHIPIVNISQVALNDQKVDSQFNKLYPQYIVDIDIIEYPGLKMRKEGMKRDSSEPWSEHILDEQYEVLSKLSKSGALKRRYYNQYSGLNYDVLEIRETDDTMWYLNISTSEERIVSDSVTKSSQNTKKTNDISEVKEEKTNNEKKPPKTINELWDEAIKNDLKIIDTIRTGAVGFVNIFETPSNHVSTGDTKQEDTTAKKNSEDEQQAIARIGAENFLSVGQKITLDLTIIGDPYWLEFGSEMRGDTFCNSFPHIIFVYDVPHKLDGQDNYIRDEKMKWATVYKILNIKSYFDNGKFKQDISGVVCNTFVFKENFKTEKINKKADETVQAETLTDTTNESNTTNETNTTTETTREVIAANVEQYKQDKDSWFISTTDIKSVIIDSDAYTIIENKFPVKYYRDKDGKIKIVDWEMVIGNYDDRPPITLDPKKYVVFEDPSSELMIIYNTETKEGIKYTSIMQMNPLDYTYGNENHLWNNSDENGNINGSKLIYDKKLNGTYDIYEIDENGKSHKISEHTEYMYNISETKNSDGTTDLTIKNEYSGKKYNVKDTKSIDNDIIESFKNERTGEGTISKSNPIGKLENTIYVNENNMFVANNIKSDNTHIDMIGHFDEDGSKSSNGWHAYSVYAEVQIEDGKTIKCYSYDDYNEAVSNSTKYSVTLKKTTHHTWKSDTTETISSYNNSIDLYRLNRSFIETNYISNNGTTHSKVE